MYLFLTTKGYQVHAQFCTLIIVSVTVRLKLGVVTHSLFQFCEYRLSLMPLSRFYCITVKKQREELAPVCYFIKVLNSPLSEEHFF